MHAAVVTSFGEPPRYRTFPEPEPHGPDEAVVEVVAAGLHPRVRSQAAGSHYTSDGRLPLVPGVDGVGRTPDGALRYFILPDTTLGAMAERTVVDLRRSIELPGGVDPIVAAAAMNPAMSSWIALRSRIAFAPGQRVLVLGATGSAGRLAIQVARLLGASHVAGAGRNAAALEALPGLGADEVVDLSGDADAVGDRLAAAGREADVVLDYLWGEPTAAALRAIIPGRDDDRPLAWVQIGSVAGPTSPIPSAALRAARLQLVGSGQGSVSPQQILAELPALAAELGRGTISVDARAVPLAEVERAWSDTGATDRIVLVP